MDQTNFEDFLVVMKDNKSASCCSRVAIYVDLQIIIKLTLAAVTTGII